MEKDFGYDAVSGKYLEATRVAENYHHWILSDLQQYLGNNVLEVGAGVGLVTQMLHEYVEGNLYSLEPSAEMFPEFDQSTNNIDKLKAKFQGTIQDNAEDLKRLDLTSAVYINVLEHIEQDVDEMADLHKLLVPGGHLCTFSPALPILYSERDKRVGHFRRYTKKEMVDKMQKAGFEVVEAHYFDFIGSFLWWAKFVALRSDKVSKGQVSLFDNVIVPLQRRREPKWIPFGKNVVVIGKKV